MFRFGGFHRHDILPFASANGRVPSRPGSEIVLAIWRHSLVSPIAAVGPRRLNIVELGAI